MEQWNRVTGSAMLCIRRCNRYKLSKKALLQKLKSVGMTLEKGKEHDGIMLDKLVEEQDKIMLANVKSQVSLHQRLEGGRSPMK